MPDPVFTLRDFLIPALAGATSFVGAWIAAKLALSNFYQQKTWERKAEAYTAIFQALHAIDRWHEKHYEASLLKKDVPDEQKEKLRSEANKAEKDLERRLAGEAWLIPKSFHTRVLKMTQDLKNIAFKHTMWQEFLDESLFAIHNTTAELLAIAQKDLRTAAPWYRRLWPRS